VVRKEIFKKNERNNKSICLIDTGYKGIKIGTVVVLILNEGAGGWVASGRHKIIWEQGNVSKILLGAAFKKISNHKGVN